MTHLRYEETPGEKVAITQADVDACESIPQLVQWDAELQSTADSMRAQIAARQATQTADPGWVRGVSKALTGVELGRARIKRRQRALGFDPNPLGDRLADTQRRLALAQARARWGEALEAEVIALLTEAQWDALKARVHEALTQREAA